MKGNATGMTNGCLLRCLQDFVLKNAWYEASFFERQQLQLVCSHECVPAIGLEESDSLTILSTFRVWCFHLGPCHIFWKVYNFSILFFSTVEVVAILQDKEKELGRTETQDKWPSDPQSRILLWPFAACWKTPCFRLSWHNCGMFAKVFQVCPCVSTCLHRVYMYFIVLVGISLSYIINR